jgi:hypothetical protein
MDDNHVVSVCAAPSVKIGTVVSYHGTIEECHGPMRVISFSPDWRGGSDDGCRYKLLQQDSEIVVVSVRRQSFTI